MSTTDELLVELGEKLDKILGVLLVSNKDVDTQIRTLRALGYDWKFVGAAAGLHKQNRIEERIEINDAGAFCQATFEKAGSALANFRRKRIEQRKAA